jgi:hypothetical protein
MQQLDPEVDRVVRSAVDAYLDGSARPDVAGEMCFETRHGRYRLIDGVLFAARDAALVGAELVGWLASAARQVVVLPTWRSGSRAVLVDQRRNRHIIVTSSTRLLEVDGVRVDDGSTVAQRGSQLPHAPAPAAAPVATAPPHESTRSFPVGPSSLVGPSSFALGLIAPPAPGVPPLPARGAAGPVPRPATPPPLPPAPPRAPAPPPLPPAPTAPRARSAPPPLPVHAPPRPVAVAAPPPLPPIPAMPPAPSARPPLSPAPTRALPRPSPPPARAFAPTQLPAVPPSAHATRAIVEPPDDATPPIPLVPRLPIARRAAAQDVHAAVPAAPAANDGAAAAIALAASHAPLAPPSPRAPYPRSSVQRGVLLR